MVGEVVETVNRKNLPFWVFCRLQSTWSFSSFPISHCWGAGPPSPHPISQYWDPVNGCKIYLWGWESIVWGRDWREKSKHRGSQNICGEKKRERKWLGRQKEAEDWGIRGSLNWVNWRPLSGGGCHSLACRSEAHITEAATTVRPRPSQGLGWTYCVTIC